MPNIQNTPEAEALLAQVRNFRAFARWVRANYHPWQRCDGDQLSYRINGEIYHISLSHLRTELKTQFGTLTSTSQLFERVDQAAKEQQ